MTTKKVNQRKQMSNYDRELMEEGWIRCYNLGGDWWYMNIQTGEELPLFAQPLLKSKDISHNEK